MAPEDSQTAISAFSAPSSELTGLVQAVESILREYYHREPRFPLNPEDEDVPRLCGYRSEFGGNFAQLEDRIGNKLADTAYSPHSDYTITLDELSEIINETNYSLPLVELHPNYFDKAEYMVQPGQFMKNETPFIVPVSVEEEQVLYWDPLADFYFGGEGDTQERTLSDTTFLSLWSKASKMNWTFWIARGEQSTLSGFQAVDT